jgi:hypothetical protein
MSKKPRHGTRSYLCQWCGNQFYANHPNATYCSERCSKGAYRARKRATTTGLEGFTITDMDTFNAIRNQSEQAAQTIMHIRRTNGLTTARTAMWACWCILVNDDVNPAERPYALTPQDKALTGVYEQWAQ